MQRKYPLLRKINNYCYFAPFEFTQEYDDQKLRHLIEITHSYISIQYKEQLKQHAQIFIAEYPQNQLGHAYLALYYLYKKDYSKAEQLLKIAERIKLSLMVLKVLAFKYQSEYNLQKAIIYLTKIANISQTSQMSAIIKIIYMKILLKSKQTEKILELINKIIVKYSKHELFLIALQIKVWIFLVAQRIQQTQNIISQIQKTYKNSFYFSFIKGHFYKKACMIDKAIKCYKQALLIDSKNLKCLTQLSSLYAYQQDFTQANYYLMEIQRLYPQETFVYVNIIQNCAYTGDEQLAIQYMEKMIKQQLVYTEANRGHRILYQFTKGHIPQAFAQIQKWQKQDPANKQIYKLKGNFFKKIKRYDQSIYCFRIALQLDQSDYNIQYDLAQLLFLYKKENREAEKILLYLVKYQKDQAIKLLAKLYFQQGKLFSVINTLMESLEYFPDNAHAYYQICLSLKQIKRQLIQQIEQQEQYSQQKKSEEFSTFYNVTQDTQIETQEERLQRQKYDNFQRNKKENNITNLQQYFVYQKQIISKLQQKTQNPYILYIISISYENQQYKIKMFNNIFQNEENTPKYAKKHVFAFFQDLYGSQPILQNLLILLNHNILLKWELLTQLISFFRQKKFKQISDIDQNDLNIYYNSLPNYVTKKTKMNFMKKLIICFLKYNRCLANATILLIQNEFNCSGIQLNMMDEISSSILQSLYKLKICLQPIHEIRTKAIIRYINFPKIQKLNEKRIDQLFKQKCLQLFSQEGQKDEFKLSKQQFFKKTLLKTKAGMKFWMKTGKLQKIQTKLLSFVLSFQEPSPIKASSCKDILESIYSEQEIIKENIIEKLTAYISNKKEDELVLRKIIQEICDNVYSYSEQKYIYNQLIKFVINQYGFLIQRCLPDNLANFIGIIQRFRKNKNIHKFINNLQKQFKEPLYSEISTNYLGNNNRQREKNASKFEGQLVSLQFQDISSLSKAYDSRMDDFSGMEQLSSALIREDWVSNFPDFKIMTQKSKQKVPIDQSLSFRHLVSSSSRSHSHIIKNTIGKFIFSQDINTLNIQSLQFRKIFVSNHFYILKYLSANHRPFIAEHTIINKSIKRQDNWIKSFNFQIEKGQREFSKKCEQNKPTDEVVMLTSLGNRAIYCWLISAARIFHTLQQLGIYHADFFIRNTIKFGDIFQVIDFDYAMALFPNGLEGKESFQCALKIIQFWLYNDDNGVNLSMQIIFLHISNQVADDIKKLRASIKKQTHNQSKEKMVEKCLCLLRQYMKMSHFASFKEIWQTIQQLQVLNHRQSYQILQLFEKLQGSHDYLKFSTQIGDLFAQNYCNQSVSPIIWNQTELKKYQNERDPFRIQNTQRNIDKLNLKYIYNPQNISCTTSTQIIYFCSKIPNLQRIVQIGKSHFYSFMTSLTKILSELQQNQLWIAQLDIRMLIRFGEAYKIQPEYVNKSYISIDSKQRGDGYHQAQQAKILENHRLIVVKLLHNLMEIAHHYYSMEITEVNQIKICISSLELGRQIEDYEKFTREIEELYFSYSQEKSYI